MTKKGGVIVWIVGDATIKGSETGTSFKQALYFKEIGFNLHDTMIYQKDACAFPESNRYYPHFEYIFILSKGKPNTFNQIMDKPNNNANTVIRRSTQRELDGSLIPTNATKRNLKRKVKRFGVRGNVWKYSVGNGKSASDKIAMNHPAIFPEKLAYDHIISWSNPCDKILDPMMGSGTVGKMCKLLKRKFIGIEINKKYFKICEKRCQ